ncbi:MAG TPA: glycosyltransferase [Leptolyngbyaceae cyanobacterium M33_DOE_097]|uniref:Glycosyltransferase n=1 Tax=Oscillatoriales cyanobacterium SpSt-418 TaxID=2282169 RepID=A0A7C3PCU1_9CYAN|nr:glycosyltransferase [Leptolyngbyaceae cyanobacterium M33_DOE_097]
MKSKCPPVDKRVSVDHPIGVRCVELTQPLAPLMDVQSYSHVRVYVARNGSPFGWVQITNQFQPLSVTDLAQAIAQKFGSDSLAPVASAPTESLAPDVSVSIIVATCDRPTDLRSCLRQLTTQATQRPVEIIVVDNRPDSGLSAPVVADFPQVTLVNEPRAGVSYARNAGISQSHGEIIVSIDDDVVVAPDWLEKLVAPFSRSEVMGVTGNVLPLELETPAQQLFEIYGNGGLSRGFEPFEVDRDWLLSSRLVAPVWELGGTANAAFRACVFSDPKIGLMEETLGPGMPSGVGEDIYLFYKILLAGHTMVYQASACVWHRHRRTLPELRRQLYNYSKGVISYHLTTLLRDRDFRLLHSLLIFLPIYHIKQVVWFLIGQSAYPASLVWVEVLGHLAGPWSLWRSHQRVQSLGRSASYVDPAQRLTHNSTFPVAQAKSSSLSLR